MSTTGATPTMKAIVRDAYCSPDDLRYADIDQPVAGPDEVLVRVRAAGVDQGVWHVVTGLPYPVRLVGVGLRTPKVRVPGLDVAGVVEAVGADVTRFKPGDEVYGTGAGSFAEFTLARPGDLALKPATITFAQAAAVPTSAVAALQGLRDSGSVRAGQRVLVIGAGGGVGTFAVQLAKAYGAHVTGVCSTAKTDLVRSIGADDVIDYTRTDITAGGHSYDLILDTAGNRPLSHLRRVLTARGTLVIVGAEVAGRWLAGMDRALRAMLLTPVTHQRLRMLISVQRPEVLETLTGLIAAGSITPVVGREFPLHEASAAIRHLRDGRAGGKIVVTV